MFSVDIVSTLIATVDHISLQVVVLLHGYLGYYLTVATSCSRCSNTKYALSSHFTT